MNKKSSQTLYSSDVLTVDCRLVLESQHNSEMLLPSAVRSKGVKDCDSPGYQEETY